MDEVVHRLRPFIAREESEKVASIVHFQKEDAFQGKAGSRNGTADSTAALTEGEAAPITAKVDSESCIAAGVTFTGPTKEAQD